VLHRSHEDHSLVDAEHLHLLVPLLGLGLLKEERGDFIVEFRDSFHGEEVGFGEHEGSKDSVDQVLVLLSHELVHQDRKAGGGVLKLAHHSHNLPNNDGSVKGVLNLRKSLLEDTSRCLIKHEMAETPVIVVKQDSRGHFFTHELSQQSLLQSLNLNTLKSLEKDTLLVIQANIDGLLSEDLLSVFMRSLSDQEAIKFTVSLRVFSRNLRCSDCLQPSASPLSEVKLTLVSGLLFIVALL